MWSEQEQPAKLAVFVQLVLLLLCYGVGNDLVHCSTVHENSVDLQSLLDFKKGITEDPGGVLSVGGMVSYAPLHGHGASQV